MEKHNSFGIALKIVDWLNAIAKWVGGFLLCAMSLAVFAAVVSRYISNISLTWVEEAATFGMAWLCTLGGGLATRRGDMTSVTLGIMCLPKKPRKLCRVLACIISLIFFVFLIDCSVRMAIVANLQRSTTIPALTMFWVYIALPAGVFLMFINTVVRMIEICREKEVIDE